MLKGQRCVILADGFYEWQRQNKGKQPFFIYFPQVRQDQGAAGDQDEPMASFGNMENSKATYPPKKGSSDLTKVCLVVSCCIISVAGLSFYLD